MEINIEYLIQEILSKTHKALGFPPITDDNREVKPDVKFPKKLVEGNEYLVGDVIGLKKEAIPAFSRLNKQQLEILASHIEGLFNAFNFSPVFPENLPNHKRYRFLRDALSQRVEFYQDAICYIEFCNHDYLECPFEDYCDKCLNEDDRESWEQYQKSLDYNEGEYNLAEFLVPEPQLTQKVNFELSLN